MEEGELVPLSAIKHENKIFDSIILKDKEYNSESFETIDTTMFKISTLKPNPFVVKP